MKRDWTEGNDSALFAQLTTEVDRLIRESAHDLIAGRSIDVARLVLAQLAHVHGFGPMHAGLVEDIPPETVEAAVVLLLTPDRTATWLAERVNMEHPDFGKLICPGGKLEPGQSAVVAAAAETKQEVGLTIAPERFRSVGHIWIRGRHGRPGLLHLYIVDLGAGEIPMRAEVSEHGPWASYSIAHFGAFPVRQLSAGTLACIAIACTEAQHGRVYVQPSYTPGLMEVERQISSGTEDNTTTHTADALIETIRRALRNVDKPGFTFGGPRAEWQVLLAAIDTVGVPAAREPAQLRSALDEATRLCDKPGCTSAIIRKDDGRRVCASGHGSRWVDVATLEASEKRVVAAEATARNLATQLKAWANKPAAHDAAKSEPVVTYAAPAAFVEWARAAVSIYGETASGGMLMAQMGSAAIRMSDVRALIAASDALAAPTQPMQDCYAYAVRWKGPGHFVMEHTWVMGLTRYGAYRLPLTVRTAEPCQSDLITTWLANSSIAYCFNPDEALMLNHAMIDADSRDTIERVQNLRALEQALLERGWRKTEKSWEAFKPQAAPGPFEANPAADVEYPGDSAEEAMAYAALDVGENARRIEHPDWCHVRGPKTRGFCSKEDGARHGDEHHCLATGEKWKVMP